MERRFVVRTDELVDFEYHLAGLGTRFLALCVDTLVQIAAAVVLVVLLIVVSVSLHAGRGARIAPGVFLPTFSSVLLAIWIFAAFAVFFGYFIVLETVWDGRTIGKRCFGIRVVRDGGQRCDPVTIVIRNVVRIVDAGLGCYLLSAIVMLISPQNKRLGDYAAGTIVVFETRSDRPFADDDDPPM